MAKEFKTISKSLVYENPWMRVYEHKILRHGSEGVYGVVHREHSVIMIPLTPSNETILLKQYRYPTDENSWELPMGGIHQDETAEQAARRELLEETSLHPVAFEQVGSYYAVPGLTPQRVSVFVVGVSDAELKTASTPEATDDIQESRLVKLHEVYSMVERGSITDGFTLVALFLLKLHLENSV